MASSLKFFSRRRLDEALAELQKGGARRFHRIGSFSADRGKCYAGEREKYCETEADDIHERENEEKREKSGRRKNHPTNHEMVSASRINT